jgi:hypothetical protein
MGSFFSRKPKVPEEKVNIQIIDNDDDNIRDPTNHKFQQIEKYGYVPRTISGGTRRSKKHSSRKTKRTRRR